MSITYDREKTATPDVDKDPDRIPEGNMVVGPVRPAPKGVFSTAAAVPLQRTKTTPWLADATRVVVASMRRIFLAPRPSARRARKRYLPPHYGYLERFRMAREMDRL